MPEGSGPSDAPVLGLILAGGLARRMGGGDKALLRLGGRTVLERVTDRLAPQCGAGLALSANGDPARFGGFPGPVLPDPLPGHPGPLAGVLAGLDHAAATGAADLVLCVPGDAPFLPEDLLCRLRAARAATGAAIAVAASDGRRHPVVALWPVALRQALRAALARDERRVGAFLDAHGAVDVAWQGGPVDPFLNLNAPADLAGAQAYLDASADRPERRG